MIVDPPSGALVPEPARQFCERLRDALTYHLSDTPSTDLQRALRQRFFDGLYVERPELAFLLRRSTARQLVLLSGLTGTGKTTLLLRLVRHLRASTTQFVHYLNLFALRTQHRTIAQLEPDDSVCALAYQDIRKRLRERHPELDLQFASFEVLHHARFARLAASLGLQTQSRDLASIGDLIRHANNIPLYNECQALPSNPDEDLRILLTFLTRDGQPPLLILDNIDEFSSTLQSRVVAKCQEMLTLWCTPIIAIRTINLARLERLEGRSGILGDECRLLNRDAYPEHELNGVQMKTEGLLSSFVHNRLLFVTQDPATTPEQAASVSALEHSLEELLQYRYHGTMLDALDQWNNHSFRHVADDVADLAARLTFGADPIYPSITALQGATKARKPRNYVFKYLVCGRDALTYQVATGLQNILASSASSSVVPNVDFAILSCLMNSRDDDAKPDRRMTWGELKRIFSHLGVKEDLLRMAVNRLVRANGTGGFGFLFVQTHSGEIRSMAQTARDSTIAATRDEALIELQPKAIFFLEEVVRSCEYLFWLGVADSTAATRAIRYDDTRHETVRIATAVWYFEKRVWPNWRSADESARALPPESQHAYFRHVFPGGLAAFALRVLGSLRRFSESARRDVIDRFPQAGRSRGATASKADEELRDHERRIERATERLMLLTREAQKVVAETRVAL